MNTDILKLGSIEALVVRKNIKNLHLSVLPPMGKVRVTAPESMTDDAIRTLLATRLPWIKKQQEKFKNQARQTKRKYVSGETHYFFGHRYRLGVVYENAVPAVTLKGKTKIILQVRPDSSIEKRNELMLEWYRKQLQPVAAKLMDKWQKELKVEAESWKIQRMKTRWGSCNHKSGRILLNLELAKKPIACLEYVIVHELLHMIEKKHNENFVNMLAKYIPKWKSIKEELNRSLLSHEEWNY